MSSAARSRLDPTAVGPARIDPVTTGFPVGADVTLEDVGAQGWTIDDLLPPVLLLRDSALAHNVALMAAYCREHDVDLAPHGKTTMSPAIWSRQLDAGAWGLTAATLHQAVAMRAAGVRRVMLANELVDAQAIGWVAAALADSEFGFTCWVDSADGVALLREGLERADAPRALPVLVELGHRGGRAGCRSVAAGIEVARAVAAAPSLALAGVAGYEGTVAGDRSSAGLAAVDAFLGVLRRLAAACLEFADPGGAPFVVTAGGSAYFDRVVSVLAPPWPSGASVRVVLRAGCYVTHDHGHYERVSPLSGSPTPFRPAIEVWGSVLSVPEPDVVIVGIGKRDAPADLDVPVPLWIRSRDGSRHAADGLGVTRLMDQHAICRAGANARPRVGDRVGFGISHPCTAFDRRRVIPVLDDDDRVVDAAATLF